MTKSALQIARAAYQPKLLLIPLNNKYIMTKSALQIARAAYQPKLPKALKGNVKAVCGAATQSVADQEEIKKLFPNTYGMPLIKFEATDEAVSFPAINVGVGSWWSQCNLRPL